MVGETEDSLKGKGVDYIWAAAPIRTMLADALSVTSTAFSNFSSAART